MFFLYEKVRMAGIALFFAGFGCMPFTRTNPKFAVSLFEMFAEFGLLWKFGLGAMALGVLIFLASFVIKR